MVYLDSELIVEVLDLIVCLGEMLHRVRHQLLLLLLAGVRLLGQLKDKHKYKLMLTPVFRIRIRLLRIRDVYPESWIGILLSWIRIFSIPDPNFFHQGSEFFPSPIRIFTIPDPGSEFFPSRIRIKEFKYFNPKKVFLSSLK